MMLRLPRRGLAQIFALIVILAVDRMVSPQFFDLRMQDGRLFGSLIDVLKDGAVPLIPSPSRGRGLG